MDCDGAAETHVRKTSSTSSDSPLAATVGGGGVATVQVIGAAYAAWSAATKIAIANDNTDNLAIISSEHDP
jgi:hypothetical protein